MDGMLSGTVIDQRYTVVRVLGQGGMAVVYEVMNHKLGTACALKVLTLHSRKLVERLRQEGRHQSNLRHPNVVSVFDVVEVNGSPALLMELVKGPPLDVLLQDQRLTFDQCDALARGIFAGLAAAHDAGLIHRDLKPANILCSVTNGLLIPKIADFGLAKFVGDEAGGMAPGATRSGTTMGTPAYMAPEQVRAANKVDRRADLFSLGAILYEMACGRRAFENDDLLEMFTAIANGRFTPPHEVRSDLPARMGRAIRAALVPNREQRVRDVAALAAVWNGDRDDWTAEAPAGTEPAAMWDPSVLSRYTSGNTSHSHEPPAEPRGHATDGATYTEEVAAFPAAPPAVAPRRRARWWLPALLAAGAVTVAIGAAGAALTVGAGVLAWSTPRPAEPVEAPPVDRLVAAPPPEVAPAEPVAPDPVAPQAAVEPAPVAPPAPVRRTTPTPGPAPAPDPVPEPVPAEVVPAPIAPATTVAVTVRGDARSVFLQGPTGNVKLPGPVPPGVYTVVAFFGEAAVATGTVRLDLGRDVTLTCSNVMRTCK